jgi:hypothetical protein
MIEDLQDYRRWEIISVEGRIPSGDGVMGGDSQAQRVRS